MKRSVLFGLISLSAMLSLIACAKPSDSVDIPSRVSELPSGRVSLTPTPSGDTNVSFEVLAELLKLPKPEDYPIKKADLFDGKPAQPVLRTRRAKQYGTVIREGSQRGPNFAGHYSVVTWGAGMGNFSVAVVNARNGRVLFLPFDGVSRAGYGLNFETGEEMNPAFRIDSKLIAFAGCPGKEYEGCTDWDKDGFYLYRFENERFQLVKFVKRADFEAALKS